MTDLRSDYLGLALRSPIVASAGPFTGDIDRLAELEDAGAGAVVLPSLFQEQIEREQDEIDRLLTTYGESVGEATSFVPQLDDYNTGPDRYLALVETARARLDIPVIASLNGTNPGGWVRYARLLEDAGADAIELNLYAVAADPGVPGVQLEAEQLELVTVVADELSCPVAVKISPYYSSLASFLLGIQNTGAAGIVMFNRFYSPDLDPDTLEVTPRITLSTSAELRLPLRWIGIARDFIGISLAASTGVHTGVDAAKVLLAGADVAMTTSALLFHGMRHLTTIEEELREWMHDHGYESVTQMRGSLSQASSPDPAAFERANYIGNIATYTGRFLSGHPSGR